MKTLFGTSLSLAMMAALLLSACGAAGQPAATPTLDVQATVNAGIQGTQTAQAAVQESIDQAVEATLASLPPTATPPAPVEYVTLSEEELAALIDEAVNEAIAATEQTNTATSQATSDGTVTDEEISTVEMYYYGADQAIAYAEELIAAYSELYGDYASEAIAVLEDVEQDLEAISQSLDEIYAVLEQGSQAASAAIEQLNSALETASTHTEEIHTAAQNWQSAFQAQKEERLTEALSLPANEVAGDLSGTIQMLYQYVDSIKAGFSDGKISRDELLGIAQLGANAQASLQQHGGAQLQGLNDGIRNLTSEIAGGQWPQARGNLGTFEHSLPERPSLPGRRN